MAHVQVLEVGQLNIEMSVDSVPDEEGPSCLANDTTDEGSTLMT